MPRKLVCVDGYVRVSRVGLRKGERFISPLVQEEAVRGWAGARGVRVLEVFVELDESGGRWQRPVLAHAIERVESGVSDGIVVARLDRFGRSLIDGLHAIERIHLAGGSFVAVQEGLDLSTDSGRLMLRILLAMAEWERERTRASWEIAKAKAIARGLHIGATVPVGYRKTRGGRLRLDAEVAPVVAEAFRRRAAGDSQRSIGRFLEAHGVLTGRGNPGWSAMTIARLLSKRVYLGEARCGPFVNEHAHPPLLDAPTWELAQRPRVAAAPVGNRPALLRGLVRCASCRMRMTPHSQVDRYKRRYMYVCRRESAAGRCPAPAAIQAHLLEPLVEDVAFDLLARRRGAPKAALRDAERRVEECDAVLTRYRDSDQVLKTLGEAAFAAGLTARYERLRDARLQVVAARARLGMYDLPATSVLEREWSSYDADARHDLLAKVIDVVFVGPGRLDVDERIVICPAGTAPTGLPRLNGKRTAVRPVQPRREWIRPNQSRGPQVRWNQARLERELRAFTRGRNSWPPQAAFYRAGRARLHRQVMLQGGEAVWAHHLGLPVDAATLTWAPWTTDRVRAALELYLADKTVFPPIKQFQADGLARLRRAVTNTGGVQRWTEELQIPCWSRCNGPYPFWTDDRIRSTLARLCERRMTFPTHRDFRRAGLAGLYAHLYHQRTMHHWVGRMGLPREGDLSRAQQRRQA